MFFYKRYLLTNRSTKAIRKGTSINIQVMNNLRNSVRLIGHLGKDPEIKQLESGNSLARASLATKEVRKTKEGEKIEDTQWHQIIGWGKTAELMGTLLKKGKQVAINGKLVYRTYEDKNGIKRTISEVVVSEFMLMA